MPREIGPRDLQTSVRAGFDRMKNFRAARLMFIRSYVGQYYDREKGQIGTEPLNLIFNAIRVLVPNLVMNFPKHHVTSEYLAYREYGTLLAAALNFNGKQIGLRDVYRRWIVDALFTLGITKTGLAESGSVVALGPDLAVDPGEIYTKLVDFDNFVFDPTTRGDMRESTYFGDRCIVSRNSLLETGLYNNELVERLPSCSQTSAEERRRVSALSAREVRDDAYLEEMVEVVELWVPSAGAIVTIPGGDGPAFDDFLRIDQHDGHPDGPYTLLSFTPPVPNNPLPVSMVGIWHDLHTLANNMAAKIATQAARQKDVVAYRPAAADDAVSLRDAGDGDAVAVEDPSAVNVLSFGGQQPSNEQHMMQLHAWFNMLAGNPQGVGGEDLRATSATEAGILQNNASIGLNDMQDLIYIAAAKEAEKRAYLLHTDPLIELPLVVRQQQMTPFGVQPQEVQVLLTPEARRGDFMDFAIEIQPESLQRVDRNVRLQRALDFGNRILPTAVNAAMMAQQAGIPFNLQVYVTRMAEAVGIEWMDEVWFDPSFQQRMAYQMAQGPQVGPSKGQAAPAMQPGGASPFAAGAAPTDAEQQAAHAQAGAAQGQREQRGVYSPQE